MFDNVKKTKKISDNIIRQIRDSILSGEIKSGDKLASEKELIEQFGVSKATMREALRVLEVTGLIEIRKGTSGGVFVAEVSMKTTIHGIINFLHFQPVSIKEITMLRYLLEPTVARVAASRRTDMDIKRLEKIIAETITSAGTEVSISFHRYLASMTENPMLILIIDFIDNILKSMKIKLNLGADFYQHVQKAHGIILECLIQKDSTAAGIAMTNDLLEVGRYIARVDGTPPFDPSELLYDRAGYDLQLILNPQTRVVYKNDPILQERGALIKRVGSGQLYLVVGENKESGPGP